MLGIAEAIRTSRAIRLDGLTRYANGQIRVQYNSIDRPIYDEQRTRLKKQSHHRITPPPPPPPPPHLVPPPFSSSSLRGSLDLPTAGKSIWRRTRSSENNRGCRNNLCRSAESMPSSHQVQKKIITLKKLRSSPTYSSSANRIS